MRTSGVLGTWFDVNNGSSAILVCLRAVGALYVAAYSLPTRYVLSRRSESGGARLGLQGEADDLDFDKAVLATLVGHDLREEPEGLDSYYVVGRADQEEAVAESAASVSSSGSPGLLSRLRGDHRPRRRGGLSGYLSSPTYLHDRVLAFCHDEGADTSYRDSLQGAARFLREHHPGEREPYSPPSPRASTSLQLTR
jgi:hypothetical protein